ncbi:MAG: hypothetical protein WBN55_05120 [Eudoraea sp.]|uniref:hypothetical protein n=1 Tax=Eudoraea sp. TaxID=1979955 RepID=UPI003C7085DA
MKTKIQSSLKAMFKLAIMALIVMTYSCSKETAQELKETQGAEKAISENTTNEINYVLETFIQGSPISGANGIDIGPEGNLYIASVTGQEIVVMKENDGEIIDRIGPERGVLGPDDLVFGPDGTLYWTDILTGFVGRMTADGQQLGYQFVAPGVNPIGFSPDGRLFVALDFLGDGLYELDPNLVEPPRPIVVATEDNPFPLGFLNAFDFCSDGRLYGPLFALGYVISVNVDADNPVTSDPFNDPDLDLQIVATGFKNPAAAKFGPDGLLYVLDQTGEVFKVNVETGEKTLFITCQPGLDNLVFCADGAFYMTNADYGWVDEIQPSGESRNISRGGLIAPQGLAVLPGTNGQDALYEADLFNLRQFNTQSGEEENIYKGFLVPEGPESLILPMNISTDGNNLVVSSWFSGGVQVWNPQDGVIEAYPAFPVPMDALRFKDDIIVSDAGLGGSGLYWASSAEEIALAGITVGSLGGLATDGETVWAADWVTGNILQIGFDGKTPTNIEVIAGLQNPEGLALDETGGLLVVEWGAARLSRIDLLTGERTTIAEGLELGTAGLGAPPGWSFDGVTIGSSGDIYVSGAGANVIYRVTQE